MTGINYALDDVRREINGKGSDCDIPVMPNGMTKLTDQMWGVLSWQGKQSQFRDTVIVTMRKQEDEFYGLEGPY